MAIAYDTVGGNTGTGNSLSSTHDGAAGATVYAGFVVSFDGYDPSPLSNVTYDGQAMTFVAVQSLNNTATHGRLWIYKYVNIAGGSKSIAATCASGGWNWLVRSISYTGVDSETNVPVYGSSKTVSQSPTCDPGQVIAEFMVNEGFNYVTGQSGGTDRGATVLTYSSLITREATTGTTFTADLYGYGYDDPWACVALILSPAGGGTTVTPEGFSLALTGGTPIVDTGPVTLTPTGFSIGLTGGTPLVDNGTAPALGFDAAGGGIWTSGTTFSWTQDIAADATAILIPIDVAYTWNAGLTISSVTVDGTSVTGHDTVLAHAGTTAFNVTYDLHIYLMLDPPTGTGLEIEVTFSTAPVIAVGAAITVTGATGFGTHSDSTGTATAVELAASAAVGDFVVNVIYARSSQFAEDPLLTGYTGTSRGYWGDLTLPVYRYMMQLGSAPGAATVDFDGTLPSTATGWVNYAIPVTGAPAGDVTVTPAGFSLALTGGTPAVNTGGNTVVTPTGFTLGLTGGTPIVDTGLLAPVGYDAVGSGYVGNTAGQPVSFTHTPAHDGARVIVYVLADRAEFTNGGPFSYVRYNGAPMTPIGASLPILGTDLWTDRYGYLSAFEAVGVPAAEADIDLYHPYAGAVAANAISFTNVGSIEMRVSDPVQSLAMTQTVPCSPAARIVNCFGFMDVNALTVYQAGSVSGGTTRYNAPTGTDLNLTISDAATQTTFTAAAGGIVDSGRWVALSFILRPTLDLSLRWGTPRVYSGPNEAVAHNDPWYIAHTKLQTDQGIKMWGSGDSTMQGAFTDEQYPGSGVGWIGRYGIMLAKKYDMHCDIMMYWNNAIGGHGWVGPTRLFTGSRGESSPVVEVWNSGIEGTTITTDLSMIENGDQCAEDEVTDFDCGFLGDGFNEGGGHASEFVTAYQSWIAAIRAYRPTMPIVITTQNNTTNLYGGQFSSYYLMQAGMVLHYTGMSMPMTPPLAMALNDENVWVLDTIQAYMGPNMDIDDYCPASGGVHPNSAGYWVSAEQVMRVLEDPGFHWLVPLPAAFTLTGGTPEITQTSPAAIKVGATPITAAYVGDTAVSAIYVGANQNWP